MVLDRHLANERDAGAHRAGGGGATLGPRRQLPAKRSTVLRISHFRPRARRCGRWMRKRRGRRCRSAAESRDLRQGSRHPLMHRTETIDYAIVLSGEITMVLDESMSLRAGDVVVQRHQSRLEQPLQCALRGCLSC
jgi:hypothetical protein